MHSKFRSCYNKQILALVSSTLASSFALTNLSKNDYRKTIQNFSKSKNTEDSANTEKICMKSVLFSSNQNLNINVHVSRKANNEISLNSLAYYHNFFDFMNNQKFKFKEISISMFSFSKFVFSKLYIFLSTSLLRTCTSVNCVSPAEGIKFPNSTPNAKKFRIGIVKTMWNQYIIDELVKAIYQTLEESGLDKSNIEEFIVPGSYELPYAAKLVCNTNRFDAIICVGCLIKGDSMHFEYISESVSRGLMQLQLSSNTPIIFGVLTCMNVKQAEERAFGANNNHGISWAKTAIQMAEFRKRFL